MSEIPEPSYSPWHLRLYDALAFYDEHSAWPSQAASDPIERSLGNWVLTQRKNGRKLLAGERSPMTAERFNTLDSLPEWEWSREARWEDSLAAALTHFDTYGSWPSQWASDPQVRQLGNWVNHQRKHAAYLEQGRPSQMTVERLAILKATPGWRWAKSDDWFTHLDDARAFHRAYGRWPAQSAEDPDERRLGNWVQDQRKHAAYLEQGRPSQMTVERYYALCDTPEWVWSRARHTTS